MDTFIGIFDDARSAQRAMAMLKDSNLSIDDVSVISRTGDNDIQVNNGDDVKAGQGATVGALWGGVVGLASLAIPGVGPFIASGAFAAALASAATGAVTGAVVGGISAALIDFSGIPEEEAHHYESLVYSGKTLVAGKARPEDMQDVRRILHKAGGEVEGETSGAAATTDSDVKSATTPGVGVAPTRPLHVAVYDSQGQRIDEK